MAKFEVLILPIDKVENHPNADRLSLNHVRGLIAVTNKDKGAHRFSAGQLVAFVPENAIVPDSLLKARGYWDEKKGRGFLGGERGNIVRPFNLREVLSHGLIFATEFVKADDDYGDYPYIRNGDGHLRIVNGGADVTHFLGITKYLNPYPHNGILLPGPAIRYPVEDLKKFPNMLDGQQVVVTELLHGILCIIGYDRTLSNPFFVMNGSGQSLGGDNIYTQTTKSIWEEIKRYLVEMPAVEKFYIFGEIIGPGIQDITYGLEETEFRGLDIQMGLMGSGRDSIPFGYIGIRKYELFKWMNIATAPLLWGGKFDRAAIDLMTIGPAAIGGGLRKGVVITAEDENFIEGRRPILKNISDKYLLRSNGTEYK